MALTNNLKKQVDQPVWEWARFNPAGNTTSVTALTTADDGSSRYLYYLVSSTFLRYDTVSDSWAQLANPATAPSTVLAMCYQKNNGQRGRVLGAIDASNLRIPYLSGGNNLIGVKIRITAGTGAGQVRTITAVTSEEIHDSGVTTSSNTSVLIDTTRKWKTNQWVGYTCRFSFSTGQTLQRAILLNSADTMYFYDVNYHPYEPYDNTSLSFTPSTAAGSQTHFNILSQKITVDTPFTITPDSTSRFMVETGVIWVVSTGFTLQMYDILNDVWHFKTANGSIMAGLAAEFPIETFIETSPYVSGTATAGSTRTLTDATKSMTVDRWRNYYLRITGGTGMGQEQRIISNGTDYFEVAAKWVTNPDNTSTYTVIADVNSLLLCGNSMAGMFKYNMDFDFWHSGSLYEYGMTNNMAVTRNGTPPLGVSTAVRNTGGITSVTVAAGGSNYKVGDVLTISGGGGTNGKVYVETINSSGAVLTVSLARCGAGYSVTAGAATTGGTGTLCTINIATIGVVGLVTTVINHHLKIGDVITFSGATEAAWNTTYTIIGCDPVIWNVNPTTFDVAITATANAVAANSQSTTLIVDPTKNWDVNEHVGKLVQVTAVGYANPVTQLRRITANTATTITVATITAAVNGTSRYAIIEQAAFGKDTQFYQTNQYGFGHASSGSTTTLVDNTKAWVPGAWNGYRMRIVAGTGYGTEILITSNDATTLTYPIQTFTPDATTRYEIYDTFGFASGAGSTTSIVDTTKNWRVNQWAGKRVRVVAGAGLSSEVSITSNTSNTLTLGTAITSTDATTVYTIYGSPIRGQASQLYWTYGDGTDGKSIWSPRGNNTATVDRFDIPTELWEYNIFISPQTELFTTGSMYSYDYGKRIYMQKDTTGRLYYFDVEKREITNSSTIPYGHSSATWGNKMAIIVGPEGLQYIYMMRHTGTEMFRALIFW